ncbi:MAG: hypothetical protein ACLTSG_05645 [Lachnospiraceae bacterium]
MPYSRRAGTKPPHLLPLIIGGVIEIAVSTVPWWRTLASTSSAPIGTLSTATAMCVMDYIFPVPGHARPAAAGKHPGSPVLSCAAMGLSLVYGLAMRFLGGGDAGRLMMALCMCLAIGAAVIVYLVLTVLTRAVTYEDMKLIPRGEKLARLLRIRP